VLAGQVEALDRTFAEFGDLPVNPRVVGKAGEEAGGAAGRVGAAGFVEAEELAQGTGPQVGRAVERSRGLVRWFIWSPF
jgi:hypothetical protein